MKKNTQSKSSTERALNSRTRLIDAGGERFEVRLQPGAALNRKTIMDTRKIEGKTELMETLLNEEAIRLELVAP